MTTSQKIRVAALFAILLFAACEPKEQVCTEYYDRHAFPECLIVIAKERR